MKKPEGFFIVRTSHSYLDVHFDTRLWTGSKPGWVGANSECWVHSNGLAIHRRFPSDDVSALLGM